MQNLPNPNDFEDWRSWASVLQAQVEQELLRLSSKKAQVELIKEQPQKPRSGYPIASLGDLVAVHAESGPVLKIWDGSTWKTL